MANWVKKIKDFLLFSKLFLLLKPFSHFLKTLSNFSLLTGWINQLDKGNLIINDFYTPSRNYNKRYELYNAVGTRYSIPQAKINYLEFGVAIAASFKWWLNFNPNPDSRFYGFDTFEGLPEDWGHYKKGAMSFGIPEIDDKRVEFIKGIFQDTLNDFLNEKKNDLTTAVTVVHLDADLFSSTIFVLSQLYQHLKKGDIIFFDEFNVPNHEFSAYKIFTETFGLKMKLVGAVNNFYQVAFTID